MTAGAASVSIACCDGSSVDASEATLKASKLVQSLDLPGLSGCTKIALPFSKREVEAWLDFYQSEKSSLSKSISFADCVAALKVLPWHEWQL
jgi:hypothetical protein